MDLAYIIAGLFVNLIFLFRIEWLRRKESFEIILGLSLILFLAGAVLLYLGLNQYSASEALLIPLVSLLLFRLLREGFIKLFEREPEDTAYNWQSGLLWDRVFAFLYWGLSLGFAIFVVAP